MNSELTDLVFNRRHAYEEGYGWLILKHTRLFDLVSLNKSTSKHASRPYDLVLLITEKPAN